MILISSPYSHPDVTVKIKRVERLAKYIDAEIKKGNFVFSPVLYGLTVLKYVDGKDDWPTWKAFCENAILSSKELWVLKFDGWDKSAGVSGEILFATLNKIPIKYIDIEDDEKI